MAGTADTAVRISTWDPQQRAPGRRRDRRPRRSSCRSAAGWTSTTAGSSTSASARAPAPGVAWRGAAPDVAGTAPDAGGQGAGARSPTRCSPHNHFGAYTHEAQGMHWSGNTFSDNEEYGFDPHDFSNDFVVEGNTAHDNGKHGFIFSRGCMRNVLRDNTAYDNAGHGFMIDDGRSAGDRDGRDPHRPVRTTTSSPATSPTTTPAAASRSRAAPATSCRTTTCRATTSASASRTAPRPPSPATRSTDSVRYGVHVLDPAARVAIDRQPHLRVLGGDQPRRGGQRDAGREPVDRRLDAAGGRRRGPRATVVDRPGRASSCTGTPCWCCGR